jgi:hypothetical protein
MKLQVTFDQEEGRDIIVTLAPNRHPEEAAKALATLIAEGMASLRQEGTINIYYDADLNHPIYHTEIFDGVIAITE